MIEICIHLFLYLRKIYPNGIFKKQKKYGSLIYVSIYPPLNKYINDVLKGAKHLNKLRRLNKIEIQLYTEIDDDKKQIPLETFILDDIIKYSIDITNDEHLIEFEESCKIVIMELYDKLKNLKPLPKNTKFKISLITTQSAYVNMITESKIEESHCWMQEIGCKISGTKNKANSKSMLPIAFLSNINFHLIKH